MPLLRTTVGQLMVNDVLPEDMRSQTRVLDKKGLSSLLREVATRYPDRYREISHKLVNIGWEAAQTTGGFSFGLEALRQARVAAAARKLLRARITRILDDPRLDEDGKDAAILKAAGALSARQGDEILGESLEDANPLAYQVLSGSRGSKMNLASLRGSDLLYVDHRNRPIPFPILRSYSQGLSPAEYWAGSYGARRGIADVKFATRDAGYLGKQLNQIVHRLLVTAADAEQENPTLRGYPVGTDDEDSEGAFLASPAGGYARHTVLSPKILADLREKGVKRILVRSPIAGGPADGGIYARDAGVREFNRLPSRGENVAMAAVQALAEPVAQGALSSKHSGGVAGAAASQLASGFDYVNSLIQVPKTFKGGAAHSQLDGTVLRVEDAPTGGKTVWIEDQPHHVAKEFNVLVCRGDKVEAGDVISEGLPNPAVIVKHKGIGEGRRYFVQAFRDALRNSGMSGHRRNIELLARGLINHVRLTDETDSGVPDDIVPYHELEHTYQPRSGFRTLAAKDAVGKYLERPYLHYTIGTKVRPKMLPDFEEFGVRQVDVHDEPPPFEPEMIRGMASLQHDPDWLTRMFGSGLKAGLLRGVHRGAASTTQGTSFVPGLVQAVDFGQVGKVITPRVEQQRQRQERGGGIL